MRIVFLEEDTVVLDGDVDLSGLKAFGEYEGFTLSPAEDPLPACGGADIVIVNKMPMTGERMRSLPGLKCICVAATGYDNVDIESARELGVRVANVAGYAAVSVAQHAFAMILHFAVKLSLYAGDVSRGEWESSTKFNLLRYRTFELKGRKLGIIGLGAIGKQVAAVGEGFGMEIIPYDIADLTPLGYRNLELDFVLGESDVITVHCPLTEETRNLIDANAFSKMKKSAFLINTARGGVVNEADLADALNSGTIAGAGVDTLSHEPPREGNPLTGKVKNLILSPHTAWTTVEARQRLVDGVVRSIERFIADDPTGFIV